MRSWVVLSAGFTRYASVGFNFRSAGWATVQSYLTNPRLPSQGGRPTPPLSQHYDSAANYVHEVVCMYKTAEIAFRLLLFRLSTV